MSAADNKARWYDLYQDLIAAQSVVDGLQQQLGQLQQQINQSAAGAPE